MRNSDNIRQIEKLGIDIIGFIFYPKSPRYISERPVYLPENIRKAGVFVNEKYSFDTGKNKIIPPRLCTVAW